MTEQVFVLWLLVHPDMRAVPRVRRVVAFIRDVFKESRAALQGVLPTRRSL